VDVTKPYPRDNEIREYPYYKLGCFGVFILGWPSEHLFELGEQPPAEYSVFNSVRTFLIDNANTDAGILDIGSEDTTWLGKMRHITGTTSPAPISNPLTPEQEQFIKNLGPKRFF
jgi:hypothetical protein